jgi:hypothetical protein
MDRQIAEELATKWAAAWNDHDLDAIMAHFADDVVWTSPAAETLVPGSGGHIEGKAALRDYYGAGLRKIPDLHFEILGLYLGVRALVVNYRNQRGALVNEVLIFGDDWLVHQGHGTYLAEIPA